MILDDKATCAAYGRRATPKRYAKDICIEGRYVNLDDIAERLGVTREAAKSRWSKAKAEPEPVTWAKLNNC